MNVYTVYSQSHVRLFEKHFLPSFETANSAKKLSLFAARISQKSETGEFESPGFRETMADKLTAILTAIHDNREKWFLFCDCDCRFYDDFAEDIFRYREKKVDVYFQDDFGGNEAQPLLCAGFMLIQANEKSEALFKTCLENLHKFRDDQAAINYYKDMIHWRTLPPEKYFSVCHALGQLVWTKETFKVPIGIKMHHANWTRGTENKERLLSYVFEQTTTKFANSQSLVKYPLLYALQVYDAEIPKAIELAKFHAKLSDYNPYLGAACLLVYRKDCPKSPELEKTLEYAFPNFSVYRSKRRDKGFPEGSNALWCETMQQVAALHQQHRLSSEFVLTTEADAYPIAKDWIPKLTEAWRRSKASVVGCWHPYIGIGDSKCGHINGNAMFALNLAMLDSKFVGCPGQIGWDLYFAESFKAIGWADVPEIRNWYKRTQISAAELKKLQSENCVFLHGIKDSSVVDLLRSIWFD
jgi:hypothetical protein